MIFRKTNEINEFNYLLISSSIMLVLSVFTLNTFFSSNKIEVMFLLFTLIFLFIYYLENNVIITLYIFDVMWLSFSIYFLLNIIFQMNYMKVHLLDIIVFGFIMLFLILYKLDAKYFIFTMKLMMAFSFVYALSAIYQYIYMDHFMKHLFSKYNLNQVIEIMRLYRKGNYTGFTTQNAYLAGFLVYGIGISILFLIKSSNKLYKILFSISLFIMIYSLFLTGKRAHLMFMIISLLCMFIFSIEFKRITKKTIKLIVTTSIIIITFILGIIIYNPSSESQLGKVYNRFYRTYENLISGGDITSGRIHLYEYAIKLFTEAPIFGIGWREFRELSIGVINPDRGSHPHNIYLQLLTELGIIGFLLFMIPVIYILIKTIKFRLDSQIYIQLEIKWKIVLQYSLYIQVFFLLYGITGNLLTDYIFLLMYFFAVAIVLSLMKHINHKTFKPKRLKRDK